MVLEEGESEAEVPRRDDNLTMAGLGEKVTVYYIENRDIRGGRWYFKDNFGDELNSFSKKATAVTAAKRFAKDRAKAIGAVVRLDIEKKDGSLSKSHKYTP